MSGVVALVGSGAAVDRMLLEQLVEPLQMAAPDGHGIWLDQEAGLAHALLRTTVRSNAERQPSTLEGAAWITAEARIDGRGALMERLRAGGRPVHEGVTDDHLILHAYRLWGEDCLRHLIGDFAFAIWDREQRSLFCARDQFGVAPLYYAALSGVLVVSNSLASIRAHPGVSDALDERTIGDFLLFGRNMDIGRTTFAAIRAVPPAHSLRWSHGALRLRRYWDLPRYERRASDDDHLERFTVAFEQAVADRVAAPAVGMQLSGGLDSTSLAAVANALRASRGTPARLHAYTVVYEWLIEEEEGHFAELVARNLDLRVDFVKAEEYRTMSPDPAPRRVLAQPWGIAEVQVDFAGLAHLAHLAPVVLTGFGGDPLLNEHAWLGWRVTARAALMQGRRPRVGLRRTIGRRRPRPGAAVVPDWIDPAFARRVDLAARAHVVSASRPGPDSRAAMLSPFWVDLFNSAHGNALGLPVALVFPFFDLRLVRCVLETPPAPWRVDKRLLREAMRGRLPEPVRNRPKTPLYRSRAGGDERQPLFRLALRPAARAWRSGLLATPELSQFVNVARLRDLIEAPPPVVGVLRGVEHAVALGHWLRHQRSAGRVDDVDSRLGVKEADNG